MSKEELIHINVIREDLYQAMQIGNITLNPKHSQELYDFMNYQDKEIERLNNIMTELEIELYTKYHEYKDSECEELCAMAQEDKEILDYIKELKEKTL